MNLTKSGNLRIVTSLVLLAMLIGVAFVGYLPQLGSRFASADSNLVQYNSGYRAGCEIPSCTLQVNFTSDVSSGDVVLVILLDGGSTAASISLSDSLGSTYTLQGSFKSTATYTTTLTSSGQDNVTITDSSGNSAAIYAEIYEISGVTTAAAQTAGGNTICDDATRCPVNSSTSVAFLPGAFLASIAYGTGTLASGTGFNALEIDYSGSTSINFYSQYSTTGAAFPTYFPGTFQLPLR